MVREIERAIASGDAAALRRAAHALKGSVANFAVPAPVEAARKLEKMGMDGDLSGAPALFAELTHALDDFRREAARVTSP
jgi:HPt (histidine-containing phosphotransfer) domain-containing protein